MFQSVPGTTRVLQLVETEQNVPPKKYFMVLFQSLHELKFGRTDLLSIFLSLHRC